MFTMFTNDKLITISESFLKLNRSSKINSLSNAAFDELNLILIGLSHSRSFNGLDNMDVDDPSDIRFILLKSSMDLQ